MRAGTHAVCMPAEQCRAWLPAGAAAAAAAAANSGATAATRAAGPSGLKTRMRVRRCAPPRLGTPRTLPLPPLSTLTRVDEDVVGRQARPVGLPRQRRQPRQQRMQPAGQRRGQQAGLGHHAAQILQAPACGAVAGRVRVWARMRGNARCAAQQPAAGRAPPWLAPQCSGAAGHRRQAGAARSRRRRRCHAAVWPCRPHSAAHR